MANEKIECPTGCDGGVIIVGGNDCSVCKGKGYVNKIEYDRWKKDKNIKEMGVAGAIGAGPQLPLGSIPDKIKRKKKKVDEMLELNPQLSVAEAIAYFSGLDEDTATQVESYLDENEYVKLAEMIKQGFAENALRQIIRNRVKEIVRKKPGGGGYVLYSPNPNKSHEPKKAGEFPTKLQAKAAELQRFPPKDPDLLQRKRDEIDKLRKNPKRAAEKEKQWMRADDKKSKDKKKPPKKAKVKKSKKESIEHLVNTITESLFREEKKGSDWDEYIGKLSKQAVLADKTFQSYQKSITKKSEKAMSEALKKIRSTLEGAGFDVKEGKLKKNSELGEVSFQFSVSGGEGTADVGPFEVRMEHGYPVIDIGEHVRATMTKMDPEKTKLLKAELITIQEDELDKISLVADEVSKRDNYLSKIESKLDDQVSKMNALEITMLKNLLVRKYRKIS